MRKTAVKSTQGDDDDPRNQADVLEVFETRDQNDHQRKQKREQQVRVLGQAKGGVHVHAEQVVQEFTLI